MQIGCEDCGCMHEGPDEYGRTKPENYQWNNRHAVKFAASEDVKSIASRCATAIRELDCKEFDHANIADRIEAAIEESVPPVQKERDIYKRRFIEIAETCEFMRAEVDTLGLRLGQDLTTDGVKALKKQRDELRAQLDAVFKALPVRFCVTFAGDYGVYASVILDRMDTEIQELRWKAGELARLQQNVTDSMAAILKGPKA